jgi:hypothetical protein
MKFNYWFFIIITVIWASLFVYPSFATHYVQPCLSGISGCESMGIDGWPLRWSDEVAPRIFVLINYYYLIIDVLFALALSFITERIVYRILKTLKR